MAKPKSLVDLASTATSSTSHLPAHETRPRRPTPHAPSPRPSANLLALLATVAASSSSADGRPLSSDASPPDFLCPFLPPHFLADHTPSPRRDNAWDELYEDDRHHQGAPTPTRVRRRRRSGPLPDKYVEGVDGRWRKEHSWTLYGSSYCDCSTNTGDLSQTDAPEVDDQIDPTALPTTSATSTATSPDMTVSLPPGWDRSSKNSDLTPYILSLSLVLAVGIALLIFGCVIWRRKRRSASKDLEKKLRKHRALDDDTDDELEDAARARAQQRRLWVKATARWRPNVKISARRRRKKPGTSISSDVSSIHSKAESSVAGASPSMEMLTLESSSLATEATSTSLPSATPPLGVPVPDGETPHTEEHEPFSDVPSHESRPSHPPDYREDSAKVTARLGDIDPPSHSVASEDASLDDNPQTAQMTRSARSLPHVSVAHIATDDKSLLARMATLVSSPPEEDASTAPQSSQDAAVPHGPFVPVIDELEELSDAHLETMDRESRKGAEVVWSNHLSSPSSSYQPALSSSLPVPMYSREPSPHPPMFPAPPSKAQLAGVQYYEYPSAFEADIVEPPSDPQPSAPMFEYPSAPEDDSSQLEAVPCAPPLIDEEDELHLGLGRAYAPPVPPLTDDVEVARTSSDSAGPAPSGAPIPYPSSQLERTMSPPDYLP